MLPIHLPPLVLLHASTLVTMGAYRFIQPAGPSRENHLRATLGSAGISLGLAYLMTSYVPIAENQFLPASIPLRTLTSVLLSACQVLEGEEDDEREREEGVSVGYRL